MLKLISFGCSTGLALIHRCVAVLMLIPLSVREGGADLRGRGEEEGSNTCPPLLLLLPPLPPPLPPLQPFYFIVVRFSASGPSTFRS